MKKPKRLKRKRSVCKKCGCKFSYKQIFLGGEKITICLRDLSPHQGACTMLVKVDADEEEDSISNVSDLFREFAEKAENFTGEKEADVYVGIWANQFCFTMPVEFAKLIAKTGWKVMIDFND